MPNHFEFHSNHSSPSVWRGNITKVELALVQWARQFVALQVMDAHRLTITQDSGGIYIFKVEVLGSQHHFYGFNLFNVCENMEKNLDKCLGAGIPLPT